MPIDYNVPITFGRNGTARGLNCTGIDFSEGGTQSWTSAPVAELDIQLSPARQEINLQLEASPFLIPETIVAQQVFVFLGGLFIGYYTFRRHEVVIFSISRNILSGRPNRMVLVLPNATSPRDSFVSEDMRHLGIYLESIVFKAMP
jgi:hypothetical protein